MNAFVILLAPVLMAWGVLSAVLPSLCEAASSGARRPTAWMSKPPLVPGNAESRTDTVPGSNTIIDFIYRAPDLWGATARGVTRLAYPGNSWLSYGTEDGLGGAEIPALGVFSSGVWAGTSHLEKLDNTSVPWGDGLFLFDEGSGQWVDRSPTIELTDGKTVRQAANAAMLVYDLAEFRDGLVATCWAGGLVLSPDAGLTWRTVFTDGLARDDFEKQRFSDLNNLFFSVTVDATVPESLSVYAGSAYGINKYVYLHDTLKVTGFDFRDLAIDGDRLLAATDSGLSVTPNRHVIGADSPGAWRTFYESDGLPGYRFSAVAASGDTIWAGLVYPEGTGQGVVWTVDDGATWNVVRPTQATGAERAVRQIVISDTVVWLACGAGGLLRFTYGDGDPQWTSVLADRKVNALLVVPEDDEPEFVYAGTDDGIVILPSDLSTPWDTVAIVATGGTLSQRVVCLAYQPLLCEDGEPVALWALIRDSDTDAGPTDGFAVSLDDGATWTASSRRLPANDVAFFGCHYYLASDSGLAEGDYESLNDVAFTETFAARITAGLIGERAQAVRTVVIKSSTGADSLGELWVATDSGAVRSFNQTTSWWPIQSNRDPNQFDYGRNFHNRGQDDEGEFVELSGNFVVALGLQPTSGKPVLWAATRGTGRGRFDDDISGYSSMNGISYSRDGGATWVVPDLEEMFGSQFDIWNFAFDGNRVWAASSEGLLGSIDGVNWTLTRSFEDPWSGATIDTTVEILDAEFDPDRNVLWVGTENGLVTLDRTGANVQNISRTFTPVDEAASGSGGGAYATPVPYSPTLARSRGGVRIHYVPPVSGNVTVTIYDYANNVVRVLTEGEYREAGVQYDETEVWDGRNGEGDVVAVGTYFFVVEYESGEAHWGKIAIIP